MNDTWAHIGEVRILKELIQQLAGDLLQCEAVCRYLRGEVERLERELRLAYKRQAMSNNPFPPILAEEVQARIDELRGELNYPGEVTHE